MRKATKRSIIDMDYNELEDLVNKVYGNDKSRRNGGFCFQADMECGNDTTHEFSVTGNLEDEDPEYVEAIRAGNFNKSWLTGTILNMLCVEGHIEKGNYLISISY